MGLGRTGSRAPNPRVARGFSSLLGFGTSWGHNPRIGAEAVAILGLGRRPTLAHIARRPVTVSKFLAKHLRHAPQAIGLRLDDAGWADVEELLAASARAGSPITRAELDAAVHAPGKRRYAFDAHGRRVRAVQGHSVAVELGYAPVVPPPLLYHGTHPKAVEAILAAGLSPMRRRHVHLSADVAGARQVGARRGAPVILTVDAAGLHADGQPFYRADNGVWLTGPIAPRWLRATDAG